MRTGVLDIDSRVPVRKMDLGPIYLRALQWAMSSMTTGGSSMDAGTVDELLVAIFAMLCSIFFACWCHRMRLDEWIANAFQSH